MGKETAMVLIKDEITPQLQFTVANLKKSVKDCRTILRTETKNILLKAWVRGQSEWAPYKMYSKPKMVHGVPCMNWGMEKAVRGYPTTKLVYKMKLFTDLCKASYTCVHVVSLRDDGILVTIDLSKQFKNSYYIAFHETGTPSMVRRPLFTDKQTIQEFREKLDGLGVVALYAGKMIKGEPGFKAPIAKKPMLGYIPSAFFLLPLGNMFKYMGMWSDIEGVMGGPMLQPNVLESYFKAYFLGRMKYPTKKRVRRIARRAVWR